MSLIFIGFDAVVKARAFADAAFIRAERELAAVGAVGFTDRNVEIIGADSQFGGGADACPGAREVTLNLAVRHPDKRATHSFIRAVTGMGLATPAGMAVFQSGRPRPTPVVRLFSCVLSKDRVPMVVDDGDARLALTARLYAAQTRTIERPADPVIKAAADAGTAMRRVPLIRLAYGRSGDKGDRANIGIIAREPVWMPWIWRALTPECVHGVFAHFSPSRVDRYLMPGIQAINFVLHDVLGGGGMASIRSDAQGKAYAQILLYKDIPIPEQLAESLE